MVKGFLARLALAALACVPVTYATPISLGFIEYKDFGTSGLQSRFTFNNWTNNLVPGYDVVTAVTFNSVSLTIDHDGILGETVTVPTSMAPSLSQYSSNAVNKSFNITRAVFTATLNPADIWTLAGGGFFVPQSGILTLELLPANGIAFQTPILSGPNATPGDSWEIIVQSHTPEPATMLMSAAGLVGLILARRRRAQ